jgi:hypothetical protein
MKKISGIVTALLLLNTLHAQNNVGIGTNSPAANLDLNGTLRIRGTSPKKGSILTSNDANGNATWADPIALYGLSFMCLVSLKIEMIFS